MRILAGVIRRAFRTTWLLVLVVMLALNVATLTVGSVAALANGALSAVGVTTVAARTAAAAAPTRATVRRISARVSKRVARGAVRNVGAVAGESLPYVGAAVVLGVTAVELKEACDTMRDMRALEAAVAPEEDDGSEAAAGMVCGLGVPTGDEIKARIRAAPGDVRDGAKRLPDVSLPDVPADRDGYRTAATGWFDAVRRRVTGLFDDAPPGPEAAPRPAR